VCIEETAEQGTESSVSSCFDGGSATDKMDSTARAGRLGKAQEKKGGMLKSEKKEKNRAPSRGLLSFAFMK